MNPVKIYYIKPIYRKYIISQENFLSWFKGALAKVLRGIIAGFPVNFWIVDRPVRVENKARSRVGSKAV